MAQNVQPAAPTPPVEAEAEAKSKWPIHRIVFLSAGILGAVIAIIFGFGS